MIFKFIVYDNLVIQLTKMCCVINTPHFTRVREFQERT